MSSPPLRAPVLIVLAVAMIAASLLGLGMTDFYNLRINLMSADEIRGQDLVTLCVGITLLVMVLRGVHRSSRSFLAAGLLVYGAYTYAYFCFGMLVNQAFLLDFFIAGIAFFTFLHWTTGLIEGNRPVAEPYLRRTVSLYLATIAAIVAGLELSSLVPLMLGSGVRWDGKYAYVVLDLVFLFPGLCIAAVWNWRRQSKGLWLSGAFLVKTVALMPALVTSDVLYYLHHGVWLDFGFDLVALAILASAVTVLGLLLGLRSAVAGPPKP